MTVDDSAKERISPIKYEHLKEHVKIESKYLATSPY